MRRRTATLLLLMLAGAAGLVARSQVAGASRSAARFSATATVQHVIMISIDGMKPQTYTEPDAHGLKVPTLREMVRSGASSDGVQPVMPSVTYPSHTTMVTGANPGTHGIVTNPAWDPSGQNYGGYRWYEEDIRVPTLWQLARVRGLHTALIHWPVTVGAQADLIVPEIWRASIPEDLKLLRALSTRGVLEAVAKEFPDFTSAITPPMQADAAFTDIACYTIETMKPNLLLLHLAMVDHEEHEHGPFSPEANAAIENADAQVARVIASARKAGIWDSTVVVLVSDHGFAAVTQEFRPGVLLHDHGLITLDARNRSTDWKASLISDGGSAYIYLHDQIDDQTRRAVRDIVQPLAGAPGGGIRRVAGHDEILAMGGDPEAFLAIEAADGFLFTGDYTGKLTGPSSRGGTHGYFPDRPEMRSSLLVYGPAIGPGKIENARLIDVGPTVASWLNFTLPAAQGSALLIPAPAASHR
jgi:predicted AlkP superfamily pyrophosphatase or phosphodiesterase